MAARLVTVTPGAPTTTSVTSPPASASAGQTSRYGEEKIFSIYSVSRDFYLSIKVTIASIGDIDMW